MYAQEMKVNVICSPVDENRSFFLDFLRGITVYFIVLFHVMWLLRQTGLFKFDIGKLEDADPPSLMHLQFLSYFALWFGVVLKLGRTFDSPAIVYMVFFPVCVICIRLWWYISQQAGVALIMFCLGLASAMKNKRGINTRYLFKRWVSLATVAGLITGVTFILAPSSYVYFGAIHAILVNSIVHVPFLKMQRAAGVLGVLALCYTPAFGPFPLEPAKLKTLDYIPWFSNVGFVLLGIFAHYKNVHRWVENIFMYRLFVVAGRNALAIYLAHQVVVFISFVLLV